MMEKEERRIECRRRGRTSRGGNWKGIDKKRKRDRKRKGRGGFEGTAFSVTAGLAIG